jgi:peptidoglycan/LPS O-acetylase OafA/YrhL
VNRSVASHALSVLRTGCHDLVTPPPGNVPGLDLLRTLAISLVVSGHYYGAFADARGQPLIIGKLPFFYFGWTGVDLFFVLSGYLIGHQLWRELMRRGTIDVPRFLLKRGLRIWPYYFTFIAWKVFWSHKSGSVFLPDLFFVSNYRRGAIAGGWSLSTEEQFYILLPLLLLLLLHAAIRVRRQIVVIVGLLLILPLVRFLILHTHPGPIDKDELQWLIYMPFHAHSDGLLAGVLISWLSVLQPKYLAPLPVMRNLPVPAVLAVSGLVLRSVDREMFGFSGLALIYGGLTLFALRDQSLFARFSSLKVFYITSRLSYGMYLNHFALLMFCVSFVGAKAHNPYPNFFLGWLLVFACSMGVATVTFITIESPFLQLREYWLAKTKGRTPALRRDPAIQGSG